jgi:hypothetical protein
VFLNWDEPFKSAGGKGSRSDVDLIYYDMNGDLIPICDDNLLPEVCQFPGATPWGKGTKGNKTRKPKASDSLIVRSRHAKKKGR